MITTLTPNPSFDRTLSVGRIERGGVLRASRVRVECSGKGVNVARALSRNGRAVRAVLPANAADAARFASSLAAEGAGCRTVPIGGAIRACFTLVEPDGTATQINEPGPELSLSECEDLVAAAVEAAADSDWLVASGSLPPGAPPDLYARLAAALVDADRRLVVDTSGAALDALVGVPCAVVKPNLAELAGVTGGVLDTVGDVIEAADRLRRGGWGSVLVSLGRGGAVLVGADACCGPVSGAAVGDPVGAGDGCGPVSGAAVGDTPGAGDGCGPGPETAGRDLVGGGVWYGLVPETAVSNTVGAGDGLLAGFLSAGGRGPAALAEGLAWAGAAVRSADTLGPAVTAADRCGVRVTVGVDRDRPVGEMA